MIYLRRRLPGCFLQFNRQYFNSSTSKARWNAPPQIHHHSPTPRQILKAQPTAKKRSKTAATSRRPLTAHSVSESNCQAERLYHGTCCQGIAGQNRPTRSTKLIRTLMQSRKWSIDRPEPSGWAHSLPPGAQVVGSCGTSCGACLVYVMDSWRNSRRWSR